jgi:hypothetical protein
VETKIKPPPTPSNPETKPAHIPIMIKERIDIIDKILIPHYN